MYCPSSDAFRYLQICQLPPAVNVQRGRREAWCVSGAVKVAPPKNARLADGAQCAEVSTPLARCPPALT